MGEVKINNDVVIKIASHAISKLEGIRSPRGKQPLSEVIKRKEMDKLISVNIEKNSVIINIRVNIEYSKDVNMYDIGNRLQNLVKDAVERATGLTVQKVNITINDVIMPEEEESVQTNRK